MFKVLGSDTRREIIKKLASGPMTVSELSRSLNINKSAIFNHLEVLVEAGFLYKKDTRNEWVYYALTEKGRALVSDDKKFIILLVSSAVSLVSGFVGVYKHLTKKIVPLKEYPSIPIEPGKPPPPVTTPPPLQVPKELPYELIIGILLIVLSLALFYYAVILRRRYNSEL